MNPLDLYRDGKQIIQIGSTIIDKIQHNGKDYVGEFSIRDNKYIEWKVKVRQTGNRGRYLKFESKTHDVKFRASADGYRPEKYAQITPTEWEYCAAYALGDQSYQSQVKSLLNRLT